MQAAPLFDDIAEAPRGGRAHWIHASDGTRLRLGAWTGKNSKTGTIFVFPGRTEYIEKYGRMITDLQSYGYSVLVIDWRGQGLADRTTADPMTGHVVRYSDFQKDVAAMIDAAELLGFPKPWQLLGHSMGACIGLRSVLNGLPVSACAFTGPMWDVNLPRLKRAAAWPVSWAAQVLGRANGYAPGANRESYVLNTRFEDNKLTSDPEMYAYFVRQAKALHHHQLGGPSIGWVRATLTETRALAELPAPTTPCVTFCGQDDQIVGLRAVKNRLSCWPGAKLRMISGAKHDLFSEIPQVRNNVTSEICELFSSVGREPASAV